MQLLPHLFVATLVVLAQKCHGAVYHADALLVYDEKSIMTYMREIPGAMSYAIKRARAVVNMRQDVNYMLTETNSLLSTLRLHGLDVQLKLRELMFLNTNLFPASVLQNGNLIVGGAGLKLFSDWLEGQNIHNTLQYDLAILMTGYDIYGDTGTATLGIANIGTVCNPKTAVTIVENNATYVDALVLAHEVVHLLGGSHDGIASQNIMAMTSSVNLVDRWTFGQCSATDILQFLPLLSPNCLLNNNTNSVTPSFSLATYSGKMFDKDALCVRTLNDSRSYACMAPSLYNNTAPKGNQLCKQLYCSIPDTHYCVATYTPDGMICDRNKRCDNGKCQPDPSASSSSADTNCVLGDQKSLQLTGSAPINGTCPELIAQRGQLICYNEVITQMCCASCGRGRTAIPGCEHRDKNILCSSIPLATACALQNREVCCYRCHGYVRKRSTDDDLTTDVPIIPEDVGQGQIRDEEVKFNDNTVNKAVRAF